MRPPGRDIPAGTAVGIMLDHLLGEPPDRLHPVVYLGRGLAMLERRSYADNRPAGVAHLAIAIAAAITAARTVERIAGREPAIALGVATASAGNMLGEVALDVQRQLEVGDLETARRTVRSLVGRTPDELEEAEVVRAVIESVAENTVDAVTATIFWATVCGPAGIWVHRTVNTLDAMVGHRSDRYLRFGWASARLDDMMNWFPARSAAVAVALVSPSRLLQTMKTVRRDGGNHPSPNGGVVESAFAGALDITLGGSNDYGGVVEVRGPLGDGPAPVASDIARAVSLSRRATWAFVGAATIIRLLSRRETTAGE